MDVPSQSSLPTSPSICGQAPRGGLQHAGRDSPLPLHADRGRLRRPNRPWRHGSSWPTRRDSLSRAAAQGPRQHILAGGGSEAGGSTARSSAPNPVAPALYDGRRRDAQRATTLWMRVDGLILELLMAPCTAYRGGASHLARRRRMSSIFTSSSSSRHAVQRQ
jgi:hypothetical protein